MCDFFLSLSLCVLAYYGDFQVQVRSVSQCVYVKPGGCISCYRWHFKHLAYVTCGVIQAECVTRQIHVTESRDTKLC